MYVNASCKGGCRMVDLRGRDFLKLLDYTPEEIRYLIRVAEELKWKKRNKISHRYLEGKQIAIIFEKDSTRTRCAFEAGAHDLGMEVSYLGPTGSQMGKKETIEDTARVLTRMYDGIEYRGFGQDIVESLAKYSDVPLLNVITNEFHPTQMLADLMTVEEEFGTLQDKKLVFCGDARNNVGNSLMVICAKLGVNFTCCAPKDLWPEEKLVKTCIDIAKETGSVIMNNAKEGAIFLHCLPSFHNNETTIGKEIEEKFGIKEMEVTDEVFESSRSRVFEEAENRLHTIKAVMLETLKDE